jgi:TolB protein
MNLKLVAHCFPVVIALLAGLTGAPFGAGAAARARAAGPKLLITSNRDGKADLYLINADGSEARNLTRDPAEDTGGSWSPDGKRITFASDRSGNVEIFVMDADGANVRQLTNDPGADRTPAWSPDGKKIAFASDRTGNAEIFVMNADGTEPVNVTRDAAYDGDPAWTADGKQILLASNRMGNEFRLFSMDAGGGNVQLLPAREGGGFGGLYPACSPDGKQIAYAEAVDEARELFACNAQGREKKRLTRLGGINLFPSWSPDGKQIAFQHHENLQARGSIWLTDAAGVVQSQIVGPEAPLEGGRPAWQPK